MRPGQYDQFKIILIPQWKPTVKAGKTPPPPPHAEEGRAGHRRAGSLTSILSVVGRVLS